MLIFDIETQTFGKPDKNKDIFRYIGMYEYETDTYYFYSWKELDKIKAIIKRHRVIVGFNSVEYDEPIMKRAGIFGGYHLHIDLFEVMKKRGALIGFKNESYSLANIAKFFNFEHSKYEVDYSLFGVDDLSEEQLEIIKTYTLQDIKVTKDLFEKLQEFFSSFKHFLNNNDVLNYKWLTASISVYTYKVICNYAGLKEEYNEDKSAFEDYEGGFVVEPTKEEFHGNIYCLDFNSLYPHICMQNNLFSHRCNCCEDKNKWSGDSLFKLQGSYCKTKMGKIEETVKQIYLKRKELKKLNNPAEYALKIVINTLYGLLGNPAFKSLYNNKAAADCTMIGRISIKYAHERFNSYGYEVFYGDTDSIYLVDKFDDEERLIMIKNQIVNEIKGHFPFPQETFDIGIDARIKHIWFFKSGDKIKKKNYLFVNDKNEVKVKGMAMIKGDGSKIGYYIFNKYMIKQVSTGNIKFDYDYMKDVIYEEINANLELVARKFNVFDVAMYKNSNQIQAAIAKKYGPGKHNLIPNKYVGVGESVKYCTVDEFRNENLSPYAIILNKMWTELSPFLNYKPNNIILGKKANNQEDLLRWTNIT